MVQVDALCLTPAGTRTDDDLRRCSAEAPKFGARTCLAPEVLSAGKPEQSRRQTVLQALACAIAVVESTGEQSLGAAAVEACRELDCALCCRRTVVSELAGAILASLLPLHLLPPRPRQERLAKGEP